MEERISRTAWNVYEKQDRTARLLFPKKVYTSFVDVTKLIISDEEEDSEIGDVPAETIIENIKKKER